MRICGLTTLSEDTPAGRYRFGYVEESPYGHAVALVAAHAKRPGEVVLDIGCGYGAIAEPLRERGFTYVGLDLEPAGLDDLEQRGFEVARLDLRDARSLRGVLEGVLAKRSLGALTALDIIEHLTNGAEVLAELRDFCAAQGQAVLVVSIPNVAHIDLGAKLLLGRWDVTPTGLLDETHVALYSPFRIESTFLATGWSEVSRADFELALSDQHFPADAAPLRGETPLGDFLRRVRSNAAPAITTNQFVRAYVPLARGDEEQVVPVEQSAPFLSVLTLVAQSTLALMDDLLVALDAQSVQDFELLVLPLDLDEAEVARVEALLSAHSALLTKKSRVLVSPLSRDPAARQPLRGAVLNAGVEAARGRYVTFLDADVVVFGRWVEEFAILVGRAPGTVVRALGARQSFARSTWPSSGLGYEAVSGPETPWAPHFNAVHELFGDVSPPGSYALPKSCFTDLGLRFDEQLDTSVERELFLRAALLYGVNDSTSEVTSLHRHWNDGSDESRNASGGNDEGGADIVAARLDAEPLLLPPGSVSAIIGLVADAAALREQVHGLERERDWFARELRESGATPPAGEEVLSLRGEIDALRNSTSWQITAPLRRVTLAVRRLRATLRHNL